MSMRMMGILKEHISVKALSVVPSSADYSKRLLFSGGGRASLKAWLVSTTIMQGTHNSGSLLIFCAIIIIITWDIL